MSEAGPNRREVLSGLVGVAAEAIAGPAAAKVAEAVTNKTVEGVETLADVINHYQESGEVLQPGLLYREMRQTEGLQYQYGPNDPEVLTPELMREYTGLVARDIGSIYETFPDDIPPAERLRQAMEIFLDGTYEQSDDITSFLEKNELQPPTHTESVYNRSAASINDIVESRALQCRSGTHFFNQMAVAVLPTEELNKLVMIYTDGHVLPGYEASPGNFVGLEMTANVRDLPRFFAGASGQMGDFRVVRALPATLENLAGQKIRPEIVLIDEVSEATLLSEPPKGGIAIHESAPSYYEEESPVKPELYGFGVPDAPPDDVPRPDLETVTYKEPPVNQFGGMISPAVTAE